MFIWFTFRDSAGNPWQSGLVAQSGTPKPAFATFGAIARLTDGSIQHRQGRRAGSRDDVRAVSGPLLAARRVDRH